MSRSIKSQFVFINEETELKNRVNKGTRQALTYWGGYVRKTARNSMKKGKRGQVSKPGRPPLRHTGALAKNIYFGWDKQTETVVVGALKFTGSDAPASLEHGATKSLRLGAFVHRDVKIGDRAPIQERDKGDRSKWIVIRTDAQARRATRILRSETKVTATIQPRPFMQPAMETEQSKRIGTLAFKGIVK